jgi:hypothetical protein
VTSVDPKELLVESREELGRADGKASILLSALGIGTGVIAAALLAGDWSPHDLTPAYRVVWWIGLCSAAIGALFLCWAVWPRILVAFPSRLHFIVTLIRRFGMKRLLAGEPSGANYFDEIALLDDAKKVKAALARVPAEERTLGQLVAISKIARFKYILIRRAMLFLGMALTLVLLAVIAGR